MLTPNLLGAEEYKTYTTIVLTTHVPSDRLIATAVAGGNQLTMDPGYRLLTHDLGKGRDDIIKRRLIYDAPANYGPAAYEMFMHYKMDKACPRVKIEDIETVLYYADNEMFLPHYHLDWWWRSPDCVAYDVSQYIDPDVQTIMLVKPRRVPFGCSPFEVRVLFNPTAALHSYRWSYFESFPNIQIGEGGVLLPNEWGYPITKGGNFDDVMKLNRANKSPKPPRTLVDGVITPAVTSASVLKAVNTILYGSIVAWQSMSSPVNMDGDDRSELSDRVNSILSIKTSEAINAMADTISKQPTPDVTAIRQDLFVQALSGLGISAMNDPSATFMSFVASIGTAVSRVGLLPGPIIPVMSSMPIIAIYNALPNAMKYDTASKINVTQNAQDWYAKINNIKTTYSSLVDTLKVDEMSRMSNAFWDHSQGFNGLSVVTPAYFLFRLDRCVLDSITTIVATLKGAAQRGGLSVGIYPLLQLSSWSESYGWYAPSGDDDPLLAHGLTAQVAGQSGMLPRIMVNNRQIFSGFVATSRRYEWRYVDFAISRARIAPDGDGVDVITRGRGLCVSKRMRFVPSTGELVTESISAQEYSGANHPYADVLSDEELRSVYRFDRGKNLTEKSPGKTAEQILSGN